MKDLIDLYNEQYEHVLKIQSKGNLSSMELNRAVNILKNLAITHESITNQRITQEVDQLANQMEQELNTVLGGLGGVAIMVHEQDDEDEEPYMPYKNQYEKSESSRKDAYQSEIISDMAIDYYMKAKQKLKQDALKINKMSEEELEVYLNNLG